MGAYLVAYNLLHATNGTLIGTGTAHLEMDSPPRDSLEIAQLSDRVTTEGEDRGVLRGGFVSIVAWSRMGE